MKRYICLLALLVLISLLVTYKYPIKFSLLNRFYSGYTVSSNSWTLGYPLSSNNIPSPGAFTEDILRDVFWTSGEISGNVCEMPEYESVGIPTLFGIRVYIPIPFIHPSSNLIGWIGFPSNGAGTNWCYSILFDNAPYLFTGFQPIQGSLIGYNWSNCQPSNNYFYLNFFNITPNDYDIYQEGPTVASALIKRFSVDTGTTGVTSPYNGATFIIPAVTCGSTYPIIVPWLFFGSNSVIPPISQASGFVPLVGDTGGRSSWINYYNVLRLSGWLSSQPEQYPAFLSESAVYHYSSDFQFTPPHVNPGGFNNSYEDVPFFFATPISTNLFAGYGGIDASVPNESLYVFVNTLAKNLQSGFLSGNAIISIAVPRQLYPLLTYQYNMSSSQIQAAVNNQKTILSYIANGYNNAITNISALPIPVLETLYEPATAYSLSSVQLLLEGPLALLIGTGSSLVNVISIPFTLDGVFPICGYNSNTKNIYPNCTFYLHFNPSVLTSSLYDYSAENEKGGILSSKGIFPAFGQLAPWFMLYLNHGGPELGNEEWSAYSQSLKGQSVPRDYGTILMLNNASVIAASSFCYYGESYNPGQLESGSVYTAPNMTRLIFSTGAENYITPVGFCNAFWSNTNCFNPAFNNNLNFRQGVYSYNIRCTPHGIQANVTDQWITSVLLANNEGYACGLLDGHKNSVYPAANQTIFSANLTACPAFSTNGYANLLISVKNVGNTIINNSFMFVLFNTNNTAVNISRPFTFLYSTNGSIVRNPDIVEEYNAWKTFFNAITSNDYNLVLRFVNGQEYLYYSSPNSPFDIVPTSHLIDAGKINSKFEEADGPYPGHLLAMYYDFQGNTGRTDNIVVTFGNGSLYPPPLMAPNQTVTYDIQVPVGLLKEIKTLQIFVGEALPINWVSYMAGSGYLYNPLSTNQNKYVQNRLTPVYVSASGQNVFVNPLPQSGIANVTVIHNNEFYDPGSSNPMPPWQFQDYAYIDLTSAPFNKTQIYNISTLSINATIYNTKFISINVTPSIYTSYLNGSNKIVKISSKQFAAACFLSPDQLNDFSVFWIRQSFAPASLHFLLSHIAYTNPQGQVYNAVVNAWKGLVFAPFAMPMILNYNNIKSTEKAMLEFRLQTLGQPSGLYTYEAMANIGKSANILLNQLSDTFASILSPVKLYTANPVSSSLAIYAFYYQSNVVLAFNIYNSSLSSAPSASLTSGSMPISGDYVFVRYINGSPVTTCSASLNIPQYQSSAITIGGAKQIAPGVYQIYNGGLVCSNVNSDFLVYVVNSSNSQLIGSGQILFGPKVEANSNYIWITLPNGPYNGFANITAWNASYAQTYARGPVVNGLMNLTRMGTPLSNKYNYTIFFEYNGVIYYTNIISQSGYFTANKVVNAYSDFPQFVQNIEINATASPLPIFLSLPNTGSCNNVRFLSGYPTNIVPLPFAVLSQYSGLCYYAVIYNGQIGGLENITAEIGTAAPLYVQSKPSANFTQLPGGAINITYPFDATFYPSCMPNYGPCITYNGNIVLFNNVSISGIPTYTFQVGQTMSCIDEQFTAAESKEVPINISGLTYDLPYQVLSGNEQVTARFCIFEDLPNTLFEIISTDGTPVDYYISNILNNSYNQFVSNGINAVVGLPVHTGCASYSSIAGIGYSVSSYPSSENELGAGTVGTTSPQEVNSNYSGIDLAKSCPTCFNALSSPLLCIKGSTGPSYTTPSPSAPYNYWLTGNNISYAYVPGNYTFEITGQGNMVGNYYAYYDCGINPNLATPINYPKFWINGQSTGWSASNTINNLITNTALYEINNIKYATGASLGLLVSENGVGEVGIWRCPLNSTPIIISLCTKEYQINNFYSYNNPECLASKFEQEGLTNINFGGGCLINDQFTCAPTFGQFVLSNVCNKGVCTASNNKYNSSTVTASWSNIYNKPFIYSSVLSSYQGHNITSSKFVTINVAASAYANYNVYCSNKTQTQYLGYELIGCSYSQNNVQINNNQPFSLSPASGWSISATTTFNPQPNASYNLAFNISSSFNAPSKPSICNIIVNSIGSCTLANASSQYTYNITYVNTSISISNINWMQSEQVNYNKSYYCSNVSIDNALNGPISYDVANGNGELTWTPNQWYVTTQAGGIPATGICEACRNLFNISQPTVTPQYIGASHYVEYSCPSGYTGSILACANVTTPTLTINSNYYFNGIGGVNFYLFRLHPTRFTESACSICNSPPVNYTKPLPPSCTAYGLERYGLFNGSLGVQFSQTLNQGIGLGVSVSNYSYFFIPSTQTMAPKDQYMTNLQVDQQEYNNVFLTEFPNGLLNQSIKYYALLLSESMPFDMMAMLDEEYPLLNLYGYPPILNNVYDFAISMYSSGTSNNCPFSGTSRYDIGAIGEGYVCSGEKLSSLYPQGLFIPLGQLNEGTHVIAFDSVSETGNTSQPTVTLINQYGAATQLRRACYIGEPVVMNNFSGNSTDLIAIVDEHCDPLQPLFRGYVVSCILYSHGINGSIYDFNQSYYLAYNMPTVWNITYTLLVAPKSWQIVPVPIGSQNGHLQIVYSTTYTPSSSSVSSICKRIGSNIICIT
jgi:hypothetical protein